MIIATVFFYLFAGICVASAAMVIAAKNPVHSVLFLILAFVNAAGLFVLMGAEFLAMILIIVYVGAVAVLFLFVVMMLDVDFAELREGFLSYLPVGALVGAVLLAELLVVVSGWAIGPGAAKVAAALGVRCVAGHPDDLVDRHLQAARETGAEERLEQRQLVGAGLALRGHVGILEHRERAFVGAVHDVLIGPLEVEGVDHGLAQFHVLELVAPRIEEPALRP